MSAMPSESKLGEANEESIQREHTSPSVRLVVHVSCRAACGWSFPRDAAKIQQKIRLSIVLWRNFQKKCNFFDFERIGGLKVHFSVVYSPISAAKLVQR